MNLVHSAIVRRQIGSTSSSRNIFASVAIALIAVGFSGALLAAHPRPTFAPATVDAKPVGALAGAPQPDKQVLIQLTGAPAVVSYAAALPAPGVSTSSVGAIAAGRNQIVANKAQQAALISAMQAAGIKYTEIYRVQRAMNGVAVIVPAAQVAALSKLPGVKAVRQLVPSYPLSNSSASFVGANSVWQGIPSAQADGTGIRIGIIDTGIDYQHANFGGTGLLADYQMNDRVTLANGVFPTPKVVGGTDLAGDAYDANGTGAALIPVPDPNPTDCAGHGSHVAGIAAGFGVDASGAPYHGALDTASLSALRIQPGIAHNALLYSIRVFGCGGSTLLTVPGIDWALDPNQDMDLSDHLDVINMSLGSPNGSANELDAEASDSASLSGMVVVAAAGNSGDTYMVHGDPAVASRTISVAASWDGGETTFVLAMSAPPAIAGRNFNAVAAGFGPAVPPAVLAGDFAYVAPTNACDAVAGVPLALVGVTGKVALIDRGLCTFQTKVYNAQLGGATGVIVVQNTSADPIIMSGDNTVPPVTIPSAMISLADGATIKAQLAMLPTPPTVTGSLGPGVSLGDTMASFSSRGPSNDAPTAMKPNITAPGVNVMSTLSGVTPTGFSPGNLGVEFSGTSMATPQVAGLIALLRQLHPTFSVEELKALAMNGALHDLTTLPLGAGFRYGGGRVGAGRIDAVASANLSVAAFNADGSGTVAVTFPSEIAAATTVTRQVRIRNYGSTPVTFTLGIDTVVDNPGVVFSLPGGTSVTLLGHQTMDINVQMSGSANLLTHTFDPTISLSQVTANGTLPRYWQTEETAYLTLNGGGANVLRVPLYVAANPTSAMSGGSTVPTGGLASGTAMINLTGTGVCTGTLVTGPSCAGTFPNDDESLVTPFELQVSNPRAADPAVAAETNVRYVGVSVDPANDLLTFGVALWGPASVPVAYEGTSTQITLVTPDGNTALFTLFPTYLNDPAGDPTNVYLSAIFDYTGQTSFLETFANGVDPSFGDTRVFLNDVFFMQTFMSDLGISPTDTIHYYVDTFDGDGNQVDHLGPFTYNLGSPGLDFGGRTLAEDLPGAKIPVNFNVANLNANGSLGALLLHHHNKAGSTAEVLSVSQPTPVLQSAVSRKVHGAAGTFDLPLTLTPLTNPTTEPRQGPTQTIVFTFDKPITAATATVTEGTATAAAPTFSGNDVIVSLSGVTNIQYVTVALSNVSAADGGSGGTGTARIGFLVGDVNQNRVVTLADLGLVNAALAQSVTAATYLKDVNASGTLTLSDKGITNAALTNALPAP
jgi:subtilisin family serine protease